VRVFHPSDNEPASGHARSLMTSKVDEQAKGWLIIRDACSNVVCNAQV